MSAFLGWTGFQWLSVLAALMAVLVMVDAFIGHFRSGFKVAAQYTPLAVGATLAAAGMLAAAAPGVEWVRHVLRVAGWLAVVTGIIGAGFHHYYGIVGKPGGYGWLLHNLLYQAPQLAPLSLSAVGALAIIAAEGLHGASQLAGLRLQSGALVVVALALTGAALQASLLHYRGAFNNPLMYAPLTTPVLAAAAVPWIMLAGGRWPVLAATVFLWATFLVGFVGLGMHLRGFDRMMGGLRVSLPNVLDGPAVAAPALFTGFAAAGLVALHLL